MTPCILLVRFGLLSGHFLRINCPLGWSFVLIVFCPFAIFIYSPFCFKSEIWLSLAPVPVHWFSITFLNVSLLSVDLNFLFLFVIAAADVVPCEHPKI